MKRVILFFVIMVALCGSVSAATIVTETYSYSFSGTETKVSVEYPVSGNQGCVDAIRVWINNELGGKYKGSLDNPCAMMDFYKKEAYEEFAHPEFNEYEQITITKAYENDKVVTFMVANELYEGGAHGMYANYGVTFRKSDGKQFGMNCITSWNSLSALTRAGLRKYFKVKTNAQLNRELQVENKKRIPAPGCQPWITAKGVTFYYLPYEISYYAAGAPSFTLTRQQIMPYLTAVGKSFF